VRHLALASAAFVLTGCAALRPPRSTASARDCSKPVQRPTVVTATDSAFTITGIVRNAATLKALPGASISVDGVVRVAMTDTAGQFRLELSHSDALPTRLSATAPDFQPHLHPISMSVKAGLRLEIFMTSEPICLEPMTVDG
jgi:hypothetical protein